MTADRTDSIEGSLALEPARARLADRVSALEAEATICVKRAEGLTEECHIMGRQVSSLIDAFNADLAATRNDLDSHRLELSTARDALARSIRDGENRVAQLSRALFFLRMRRVMPVLIFFAIFAVLVLAYVVFGAQLGLVVSGGASALGAGTIG